MVGWSTALRARVKQHTAFAAKNRPEVDAFHGATSEVFGRDA